MSEKSVVPDPHEPLRHDVETESPDERECVHLLDFTRVAVPVILIHEMHEVVFHFDDPVIGYGDPVRVPSEVIDDVRFALVGLLEKHVPVYIPQLVDETLKQIGMIELASRKIELTFYVHFLERREKHRSESFREHFETDEEAFLASLPLLLYRIIPAARNHAMKVRMDTEPLTPRVKDREETYRRSEIFFLTRRGHECLLHFNEEQRV